MKQVLSVALLFIFIMSSAQFRTKNKRWNRTESDYKNISFGYYLGTNIFDFNLHPKGKGLNEYQLFKVEAKNSVGFHAGFITRFRLNDYFNYKVEPGVYFVKRDLIFHDVASLIGSVTPEGQIITEDDVVRNVKSTYLDIPMFINVHGDRWNNTRPYFQAGVSWMINLQSEEKNLDDNLDGVFRMKTHNFTWQVELGTEIYLNRFKLTPAVKGIFFFNNEWFPDDPGTPDYWAGSLTAISTRAFVFSLKFE